MRISDWSSDVCSSDLLGAMAEEGYITPQQARTLRAPRIDGRDRRDLPTGTYFADWALPEARKLSDVGYARQTIRTTLDSRLQAAARRAALRAPRGKAQIAQIGRAHV